MGPRRAAAHAELGDLLLRAADAFEEADATALQQMRGMPAGRMEPSPVVPGAGMPLNSTTMSTQLPAPASLLATDNGTGMITDLGEGWESIIVVAFAVFFLLLIALGFVGTVVSIVLLITTVNPLFFIPLVLAILVVLIAT